MRTCFDKPARFVGRLWGGEVAEGRVKKKNDMRVTRYLDL